MPCPQFQPQRVATDPLHTSARLPLIEEYEGLCHAQAEPVTAPPDLRFRYCNHGYSQGACQRMPFAAESPSCSRYNVVRRSESALEILCIQEQNYAPLRWQSVTYFIATDRLAVDLPDPCLTAQLLAFCRSYLKRFPA